MIVAVLALALAVQAERPPGLGADVELKAPAGPLVEALHVLERDARVPFAVLPELLPPDLKIDAFSHSGPLAAGLDKLLHPLKLRWDVGDLAIESVAKEKSDLAVVAGRRWSLPLR